MKTILALPISALLFVSATCMAATVTYQYPDLTIVANEEPLDAVLKSLGKEMRIYVTTPAGLNPVVNCDIQQQPVKQAFKTLLGDVSYSLAWEEKTGRLVGLTILAGGAGLPIEQSGGDMAANEAQMKAEREEGEARMVEEQEAQDERLKEEVGRHDTETAAYLKSQGLSFDQ